MPNIASPGQHMFSISKLPSLRPRTVASGPTHNPSYLEHVLFTTEMKKINEKMLFITNLE